MLFEDNVALYLTSSSEWERILGTIAKQFPTNEGRTKELESRFQNDQRSVLAYIKFSIERALKETLVAHNATKLTIKEDE